MLTWLVPVLEWFIYVVGVLIMNGVRLLLPKVVPFEDYCWLVSFFPCWICQCLNGM
ncbi:hypothetical protein RchiOBHm_Chr2g0106151 [Rosa chinensis]|uniref:Uncharacterized protein n=1 Tax=Rosa chinensis TaxID=74649 RepID=A0A2P6RNM0_ROSCH|nr:hypothetical protein RchiOBHm_Chr2g0106151 [Rosa chinensis]